MRYDDFRPREDIAGGAIYTRYEMIGHAETSGGSRRAGYAGPCVCLSVIEDEANLRLLFFRALLLHRDGARAGDFRLSFR